MANVTIDPKTGTPIVTKAVDKKEDNTPPAGVTLIPATVMIKGESVINVVKDNGDSPAKRLQVIEALKKSGGDSMQQYRTYQMILSILNWI